MTTPLTPPTFGDKYSTPLTDIGSGYAAGITSAGQSIAGAISAVMGGYDAKTGEVQEGVLDQKKSSEDTLDMLYNHGVLDKETYEKAKTSGLSAQHNIIGQYTSEFNAKLQAQLEQQKALAVAKLQEGGATGRTVLSEQGAGQRTAATIAAENERARLAAAANPANRYVLPAAPPPTTVAPVPPVLKLGVQ